MLDDPFRGFIFILCVGFAFFLLAMGFVIANEVSLECTTYYDKLIAVNGDYDYNSGLFSGGSKQSTTMLFESGLVLQQPELIRKLSIGSQYQIEECTTYGVYIGGTGIKFNVEVWE